MEQSRPLFGRTLIQTNEEQITAANVVDVLSKSLYTHIHNRKDIDYLWNYYKGDQPILNKQKQFREEINAKIVENRASEIVSFKTGYLLGEPMQYVSRDAETNISDDLAILNSFVTAEEKDTKDKEIADWFHICGTAYRAVLPYNDPDADSPFLIDTLDPRSTFVVYYSGIGHRPMMGVTYVDDPDSGVVTYVCYTDKEIFYIENDHIVRQEIHFLEDIPIIEYPFNMARIGAFEVVVPLLDAINQTISNHMDDEEQIVQALLLMHNVDLSSEDYDKLREQGCLKYRDIDPQMKAEVKYIVNSLSSTGTLSQHDGFYRSILTICGMPQMASGSMSQDSNNGASAISNGWQTAETRAKDTEDMWKRAERRFLRIALRICETQRGLNLKVSDIEIRFTRRNYENILAKAQVLTMMLSTTKIHPKLAFEHSGLFVDSELAYVISEEYYNEQQEKLKNEQLSANTGNGGRDIENSVEGESGGDSDRTGQNNDSGNSQKDAD